MVQQRSSARRASFAGVLAVVVALGGCGGDDPVPPTLDATVDAGGTDAVTTDTASSDTGATGDTATTTDSGAPLDATQGDATSADASAMEAMLEDGEVEATLQAISAGEVQLGSLAQRQASNPIVREFGRMLAEQHGASSTRLAALARRAGFASRDGDLARMFRGNASLLARQLAGMSGEQFDATFIDTQVTAHRQALAVVDARLLPSARHPELRSMIETEVRTAMRLHLRHAEELQAGFARPSD